MIMITSVRQHIVASAACLAAIMAAANSAQAQVTTLVNYSFNVPIAKVVANPCTGGFTLVNGTAALTVSALQQTTFQFNVALTSSGTGKDVTVDGLPLIVGAKPDYAYSSDASVQSTFPSGPPTYFEHTMTVTDYLERDSATPTGDSYLMRTSFRLTYNSGVPGPPVLEQIGVVCE
jgi:hypothetical protein